MIVDLEIKDQWYQDRWGKFTASEIHKLLSKGPGAEMFGVGARTYIKKKAIERQTEFWENPKLEFVKPLLWGKRYEEPAFRHYVRLTGNKSMRYMGTETPMFLAYDENSGGSPDGIMGAGESIVLGLEMKCPMNSEVHWDYCGFKDQWDLKEGVIEYYAQIQFLLMITKAELFHFVSFDERFKDSNKRMCIVEFFPDKSFKAGLAIRIKQAVKERDKLIEQRNAR